MTGPRRHTDRGSVLMLMPAAVLIVLLLGAIAVDSAIVYLGQRQAYNVAFDAANDAAGAGIDADLARSSGALVLDPVRVTEVASDAVAASSVRGVRLVDVAVEPDGVVAVTVEVRVEHLFVQAFGDDGHDTLRITARAGAEVRGG